MVRIFYVYGLLKLTTLQTYVLVQKYYKNVADSYRRLRNTMRFILGNLNDFNESEKIDYSEMPELEQWVLHRLALILDLLSYKL